MYDAVVPSSRRRVQWTYIGQSEDNVLNRWRRRIGTEAVRDVLRFSAPANYALNKHLQFVANFVFQCDYADEEIRNRIKRWYKRWSMNADYTGRTSLNGLIRKIEMCRVVDGDVLVHYAGDGKLQICESNEIMTPFGEQDATNTPSELAGGKPEWRQGVKLNRKGRVVGYNVRKQNDDHYLDADDAYLLGYFRYGNQYRGVSPILSGVNQFIDAYEATEYALAKAKVSQMVGLVTKREFDNEDDLSSHRENAKKLGVNAHVDLGLNDSMEFITPSTPSNEFQAFLDKVITVALSCIDMPFSFFDGTVSNYYGTKAAYELYVETVRQKQEDWIVLLNKILHRSMFDAFVNDEIDLGGHDLEAVLNDCEFIGARYPMWQMFNDIDGIAKAEALGFINKQTVGTSYGLNVIDEEAGKKNLSQGKGTDSIYVNL